MIGTGRFAAPARSACKEASFDVITAVPADRRAFGRGLGAPAAASIGGITRALNGSLRDRGRVRPLGRLAPGARRSTWQILSAPKSSVGWRLAAPIQGSPNIPMERTGIDKLPTRWPSTAAAHRER
jgi:hypothetical protein